MSNSWALAIVAQIGHGNWQYIAYLGCLSLPPIRFHPLNRRVGINIVFCHNNCHLMKVIRNKRQSHLVEGSEQEVWGRACSSHCHGGGGDVCHLEGFTCFAYFTWHQFHLQSSSPWARGSRRRGGDESRSPRCRALSGPPLPQDQGQGLPLLILVKMLNISWILNIIRPSPAPGPRPRPAIHMIDFCRMKGIEKQLLTKIYTGE